MKEYVEVKVLVVVGVTKGGFVQGWILVGGSRMESNELDSWIGGIALPMREMELLVSSFVAELVKSD
ncbi:hypothetical protein HPP92_020221 [Vanilla planifolia]|uniref:Uncharacterized protein n=1 Tax=Vanilla planifolia TaxID=51239 RepID=A0A835ULI4_VANPL|nr:hypothetical protein HPP92_020221 [Vanilla planifolia]